MGVATSYLTYLCTGPSSSSLYLAETSKEKGSCTGGGEQFHLMPKDPGRLDNPELFRGWPTRPSLRVFLPAQ